MGLRSRSLELLVFKVGAGALGAEIAAARLMAPWFGASTIVWANTIASAGVAAVGYALGGRLADKDPRHWQRASSRLEREGYVSPDNMR
jgi:hypothetical protein